MALLEFHGKNLEEAIANAAEALSLPAEKLKFTIISMGSRGFLGLGRKKARIGIDSEDQTNDVEGELAAVAHEAAAETLWTGPGKRGRGGEGLDFMREAQAVAPGQNPGREKTEKSKDRRPKDRPAAPQRAPEPDDAPALNFDHLPPPPTRPAPGEALYEGEPDAPMLKARDILASILEKMGFSTEITVERIAGRVILKLADTEDNALLIGSRGNTLEALELLLSRILIKKLKDEDFPEISDLKIILDIADYRARRQASILDTLRNAAAQVRRTRKPQSINGLNSSERRLVQLALRPARDLSSRNDAPRDAVIISPCHPKEKRH